ncbi:hypothetical protein [Denitrobaculum tricleocarpae]|uniref:Uncharacterized protein n=1 Tax=Denitrobaculum tricleocarpae TaxID=2591009 RepID=A0A545STN8_9PROT|nr:hypothetical protein [Denitrobaculum tricleocarpae]TQV68339.1 hypothetical protein FKG95_28980 [Denitrobaculum tricleocarpae]
MDPITAIGLVGSIASVVSLLRSEGETPTPETVTNIVIQNSEKVIIRGSTQLKTSILDKVDSEDIEDISVEIINLFNFDAKLMNRIHEKCLREFDEILDNHESSDTDAELGYKKAQFCVCRNLNLVLRSNNGVFPNDDFKVLFERFQCGLIS